MSSGVNVQTNHESEPVTTVLLTGVGDETVGVALLVLCVNAALDIFA